MRFLRAKRRFGLCLVIGLAIAVDVIAVEPVDEEILLAAITHKFAEFTTWPESVDKQAQLNLCVVGDNPVQQAFASINGAVVEGKTLKLINMSRLTNLETCQILFIDELKPSVLLQVVEQIKDLPVLTMGKGQAFLDGGGMVGFEKKDDKIQMHVDLRPVEKARLKISSLLLKVANVRGGP